MRKQWLQWLVLASMAAGCSTPSGNDGATGDAANEAAPNDSQVVNDAVSDMAAPDVTADAPLDVAAPDAVTPDVVVPPDVAPDAPPLTARTTPTGGSAMVLSADDHVGLATNRTAGTVSIFAADFSTATPTMTQTGAALTTGANSEPWAAVLSADGDTGFVILRHDQTVVRVDHLRTTPALASAHAPTGSEPTGIAISPTGRKLYVANWGEGTVTVINTADMTVAGTIDLNASLVASGVLGTVAARPALAHPRALVITNNGDGNDDDETAYVTEFYSQTLSAGVPTDNSAFDLNRQGIVYRFNLGTGVAAAPITLAPVAATGFLDSDGNMTGCFPNQLYAAALNNGRVYITSVCESPRGPTGPVVTAGVTDARNFKTEVHAAVFVVNTTTNAEAPAERVVLSQRFQALYDTASVPDDGANRRFPLIPNDLAFVPMSNVAYLTSYGSDAVFRVQYNADGTLNQVGSSTQRFINLAPAGTGAPAAGRLPIGLAISNAATTPVAAVLNENTRNVSLVSFATQAVVGAVASDAPPAAGSAADQVNQGQRFFVTGLGRWSVAGQGWNSCGTCHPDGLTDNVTWFFARGPRQTTSLDGTYSPSGVRRVLNWTAIFDEVHDFENNTRGNSGGVGAIVAAASTPPAASDRIIFDGTALGAGQVASTPPNQSGLNGSTITLMPGGTSTPNSVQPDWNRVDSYVRQIRAPRAPNTLLAADVTAGQMLFQNNNCAGCHGGTDWTISRVFYTPGELHNNPTTGDLRTLTYTAAGAFPSALNPASAGALRTASLRLSPADANNDQINCVLRAVGTFPATLDANQSGVVATGSPVRIREARTNMTTAAQGATGFNPPSLLNLSAGAPYFHAGNARTLEEAFDSAFQTHYQALSSNFLVVGDRTTQIRQLVAYLLSIDDSTAAITVPTSPFATDLCPATLP